MKKLLFAIAGAAAFSAFAADPSAVAGDIDVLGFENFDLTSAEVTGAVIERTDAGISGTSKWSCSGDDASLVKTYGGDNATAPNIKEPALFDGAAENKQYLALDTSGSELQRAVGATVDANGTYIDTLVQFTPSETAPNAEDLNGAKLAIWLGVDSQNNTTNLMVQGNAWDWDSDSTSFTRSDQAYALTGKTIKPGTWYRLTVKAIPNVLSAESGYAISAFQIFVDGTEMAAATAPISSALQTALHDAEISYASADIGTAIQANKLIPAIQSGIGDPADTVTLATVGFKGTGALDDFVVTTNDPFPAPAAIDFTLTWPQGVTPVSYTIDGGTPVAIDGNTTFPIQVPDGSVVAFTFRNADGATKTMSATASSSVNEIDATGATFGWPEYLGDAVNGAYTIDDANDLDMLRKGVLANLATLGETFKQTANIDMSQAGPFAGIGTYAANASAGLPFQGTYDGQGFKISDIDFTQRNYGGVFNQVKGGAIKNLTVENITCSTFASDVNSGEWGCAIVGNAGLGTTLQNLTAMGSFGTAAIPCRHNVAGIAIRLSGGASNVVDGVEVLETLVKDCTNNATLYGSYTKAAGITALTQDQNGVPNDYVLFDGCVNNANIAMVAGKGTEGRDGLGGILGYVADGTKMQNCVNNGTLTSVLATAKIGELIGWAQGRTLDDLGGNVASAAKKMIGDPAGSTITGFKYATVADNKATTVLPPLTAGANYLLEGDVAASETPVFTLAAAGDTIAFDTALGYTFAGTVDSAVAALGVSSATAGTVTTYTAFDAVAEVTGGAKFATLQAAVDAATAGDTVTVLADCEIAGTPLSITNNITVHNDFTIAANVNYAICIGATVSFEGSGKIERGSSFTGSPFCVGANETTRGAITVGTVGALTFTGLTVCGGSGGNLIKLENGTVNMNGGVLKDGKRGIKADADAGSYTSAIVINGGTITNNTDCAVMASAESADGTATVTINGGVIAGALLIDKTVGTYSITIPGTSTAKFDADQSTFCESGYETTDGDNDGWFTVSAKQAAGDYKVVIEGSDVAITPTAEDFDAMVAAVPGLDTNDVNAVNAALATEIGSTGIPAWQAALLGVALTEAGLEQVAIKSVSFDAEGKVVVEMADGVTLKTGRGVTINLILKGSDDLSTWTTLQTATDSKAFTPVQPALGETKKFYKVVVEFAGSSN